MKGLDGASLEGFHRPDPLPDHLSRLRERQAGDDTQGENVPLRLGQSFEQLLNLLPDEIADRLDFDVPTPARIGHPIERDLDGTARLPTALVEEAAMGDDEDPGTERGEVTFEACDRPGNLQEDLGREILRLRGAPGRKIAGDLTSQAPVDLGPSPLRAGTGGSENLVEVVVL